MCAQMRESECERCCCFIYRASAIYTQLKDQFREACLWATAKITLHYGACLTPKHTHTHVHSRLYARWGCGCHHICFVRIHTVTKQSDLVRIRYSHAFVHKGVDEEGERVGVHGGEPTLTD